MAIDTVAGIVRTHAAGRPDAPALEFEGRTITYRQLDQRSSRVANGLAADGVGPGDRVAFIDRNGPAFYEVLFGGAKVNAVNVAVNWRLAPAEMASIVNDATAKVLVVGPDFAPHVEKIEDELGSVRRIVAIGGHGRWDDYESWLSAQPATDPGAVAGPGDVALQLYTSGTTGLPKGVMLTHDNFFGLAWGAVEQWRFQPSSVNLAAMPAFHIAGSGWSLIGMCCGCDTVVVRDLDPAQLLELIPRHRVTNAFLVPAAIQMLLAAPGVDSTDFSSLHTLVYGASPITDTVLTAAMSVLGCDLIQVYGLTETAGAITQLDAADHDPVGRPGLLRSCGRPFPWVEVRVVDTDTGADVTVGSVGELWTRSRQNMLGYWNRPADTAAAITPDGWLRTGDAGYLDADGFLYLHDRVKDMIVSGGENVYPAEVENALMKHPDVADVAVIGVPDDRWGETVKAIVVLRPGATADERALVTFCREHLAHYKCPTSVDVTDLLPRNPSGKLLKRELRAPYWEGHDRLVH
jgi:long-chain acyl-CoA synthetase